MKVVKNTANSQSKASPKTQNLQATNQKQQALLTTVDGIVLLLFGACSRLDSMSKIITSLMITQATAQAWYGLVAKLAGGGVWGKWATAAPWETKCSDEKMAYHLYTGVVGQTTFYDSLFAFQCSWTIILYQVAYVRTVATGLLQAIEFVTGREYALNGVQQLSELRQTAKKLQNMADADQSVTADPKKWVAAENLKRAAQAARNKLNFILKQRKGFFRLINLPILICASAYVLLVSAHQQQHSVDLYWGKTAPAIAKVLQLSSHKSKTWYEALAYGKAWEVFSRPHFALSFNYLDETKIRQPWLRILLNTVVRAYAFLLDFSYDYVNIKGACYKVHNIQRAAHTVNFCNRHVVVSTKDKPYYDSNDAVVDKMCCNIPPNEDDNLALDTVEGHWTRVLTDVQPCKNSCSMLNANWAYTLMCNVFQFGEAISVGVFGSCSRRNRQHFPYNARASQPSKCLKNNKTVCDTDDCRECQFYETLERKGDLAGEWNILPDVVVILTKWVAKKVWPEFLGWKPDILKNDTELDMTTVSCLMVNLFAFSLVATSLLKAAWFLLKLFLDPQKQLSLFLAPVKAILKPILPILQSLLTNTVQGDVKSAVEDGEKIKKVLDPLAQKAYKKTKEKYEAYEKQVYSSAGQLQDAFVVFREVSLGLAQLGTFYDGETMTKALQSFHTRSGSLANTIFGMFFYLALFVYLLEFVGTQNVRCHIARVLHFAATGTDRVTPYESGAYFRALSKTPSLEEYKNYRNSQRGQDTNKMKIENLPYALAQAQQSLDRSSLWGKIWQYSTSEDYKMKREYSNYIANQVLPLRLPYGESGMCKISPPFNPKSYVQKFGFFVRHTFCYFAGCDANECEGYFRQVMKDYNAYRDYKEKAVKNEKFKGLCHKGGAELVQLTELEQEIHEKTEELTTFAFRDATKCEQKKGRAECVQDGACQWASDESCDAKTEAECDGAAFCQYRDGQCKPICAAYKTSELCKQDRRCGSSWLNSNFECVTRPLCTAKHEQDRNAMREHARQLQNLVNTHKASKARKQMYCDQTSTTHTLCQEDQGNLFQPCSKFDTTTIQGVQGCILRERLPLPGMDLCSMDSSYGRSTVRSTIQEAQIRKLSPSQRANHFLMEDGRENADTLRANMCSIRTNCKANVSREECADLTVGYGIDGVIACQEKLDVATGEMMCTNKSSLAKHDVCTALYLNAKSSTKKNDPAGFCQNEVPSMFPSKIECRMGLTLNERAYMEASGKALDEWSPETTCHRVAINVGDKPRTTTNPAFFKNAQTCFLGSDTETCKLVKNSKGLVPTKASVPQTAARFAKKAEQIALEEASTDAQKNGDAGLQRLVFVHAFLRDAIPLVRPQAPATEVGQAGGLQNALGYYPRVFQKLATGTFCRGGDFEDSNYNTNCVVTRTFFGELPALRSPDQKTYFIHKRHHVYKYSRDECDSVLCSLKCGEKYKKKEELPRLQNRDRDANFPFMTTGGRDATRGDVHSGCRNLPDVKEPLFYGEDVEAELKVCTVKVKGYGRKFGDESTYDQTFFYYNYDIAAPSPWQANVTRLIENCVGAYIDVFYEHIEEGTFARSRLWNNSNLNDVKMGGRETISVATKPQPGCGHGRFLADSTTLQRFLIPQIAFDSRNANEVAPPKTSEGERLNRHIWAAWAASCFVNSSTEHKYFLNDTLKAHRSILHCSHLWTPRGSHLERQKNIVGLSSLEKGLEGGLAGYKDGNYVWPLHPVPDPKSFSSDPVGPVAAEDDEWHWREMYLALRFGYIMAQLAVLRPDAGNMPGAQNSITWLEAWHLLSPQQKQKMRTCPWDEGQEAYENGDFWILDAQKWDNKVKEGSGHTREETNALKDATLDRAEAGEKENKRRSSSTTKNATLNRAEAGQEENKGGRRSSTTKDATPDHDAAAAHNGSAKEASFVPFALPQFG